MSCGLRWSSWEPAFMRVEPLELVNLRPNV
jgi:hypothetical protein